jgi:hypothetical protein
MNQPTKEETNMEQQNKEETKEQEKLLRLKAGSPKHGTRWARAQVPTTERA